MKEIPILFNAEMVRAILEGKKTQTRRPFKYQPTDCWRPDRFCVLHELKDGHFPLRNGEPIPIGYGVVNEDGDVGYVSPFGNVGDRLWVREAFAGYIQMSHEYDEWREATTEEIKEQYPMTIEYRATSKSYPDKWRPSIHMPRWASRITLKVTDIRVQRVQEISEEDAMAEGVEPGCLNCGRNCTWETKCNKPTPCYRDSFIHTWHEIYGTWDANPWVWVATFEVVK